MTYRVKEIMARWRRGDSPGEIAEAFREDEKAIKKVIEENRKPGENDPAPRRLMDRFNVL